MSNADLKLVKFKDAINTKNELYIVVGYCKEQVLLARTTALKIPSNYHIDSMLIIANAESIIEAEESDIHSAHIAEMNIIKEQYPNELQMVKEINLDLKTNIGE